MTMTDCTHHPTWLNYIRPRSRAQRQSFVCRHCGRAIRPSYDKPPVLRLAPLALLLAVWLGSLALALGLGLLYSLVSWRLTTFYPLDEPENSPDAE